MKQVLLLCLTHLLLTAATGQQKLVAITLDDAPFSAWGSAYSLAAVEQANHKLMAAIEAYRLPVAVFFTEKDVLEKEGPARRIAILNQWLQHPLVTPGNHGYSHKNYAKTDFMAYQEEVLKGEQLSRELLRPIGKPLKYFRFPYNALGRDSLHQKQMVDYLQDKGYTLVPFTIETSDYVYNALYMKALQEQNQKRAKEIAQAYLRATIEGFRYFEQLSLMLWDRPVKQIYLCHANQLHADYLPKLLDLLREEGYRFISLEEAMTDSMYNNAEYYHGPYGFSWYYRWVQDPAKRKELLRNSPNPDMELWEEYEKLYK